MNDEPRQITRGLLTIDALTDDDIRELEVEAIRTDDLEWLRVCRLAYRHEGRGNSHPLARLRVVHELNWRASALCGR